MPVIDIQVAIIGAGTAGLSARSEVAKVTDSYRVFDPGPLGTTCARVGCMPSKAFVQSAHDFHRRLAFDDIGIRGAEGLQADGAAVLARTRALRDDLVAGVLDGMQGWQETHLVRHAAKFTPDGGLEAGTSRFRARATVIATGTRPVVPKEWQDRLGDRLITTDSFFEMENLPRRMALIGLGPVGLELGQSLARLGVEVIGFDPSENLAGIADPELQKRLRAGLEKDMRIVTAKVDPVLAADGAVNLTWNGETVAVDCVLAAIGRAPNLEGLDLDRSGVALNDDGLPSLERGQLNVPGTRVYFAGDVASGPALLHEASDEGRIAGYAAVRDRDADFCRRVPLQIVFTDPQIASVGATWAEVQASDTGFAIGTASFDAAGRKLLARASGGAVHIYAEKATARLLGAALFAPEAEHIAHLLAYAIDHGADLRDLLRMPFYHPTHEEVLRRAIRSALADCQVQIEELEEIRCHDSPVDAGPSGDGRPT